MPILLDVRALLQKQSSFLQFTGKTKKEVAAKLFNNEFEIPDYLSSGNIPSLNGLRAISILWVLCGHLKYSHNISPAAHSFLDVVFGSGQMGVKLFFVISGFLITSLLIKEKIKTNTISLKNFYIRRFLRIFPVFYLYLAVVFILSRFVHMDISGFAFLTAALYITNFYFFGNHWSIIHSWSLSVEEQYYFLWPSIFKKSVKVAVIIALLFVCIAPVIRVVVYYHSSWKNYLLAPFFDSADGIFIGSLMAIISFKGMINWTFFKRYKVLITVLCFLLMWFISYSTLHGRYGKLLLPLGSTITAATFCLVIISSVIPSNDPIYRILNSAVFNQIGKLSYSIYVWQQLFLIAPEFFPSKSFTWNTIPVNLIMIALISTMSYYWFEKYFLRLKEKFKA